MKRAFFLIDEQPAPADTENRRWLPRAFSQAGWTVNVADHRTLTLADGEVQANGLKLRAHDLVWPVGFGPKETFIDRWQLLAHSGARLINPPASALLLHGKLMWGDLMPETHASSDAAPLMAVARAGGRWVLKPAAGSFGRDVRRVNQPEEIADAMASSPGYWLLQRHSDAYAAGEHRTLVVGGTPFGTYRRTPAEGMHANLAQGGSASEAQVDPEEQRLIDVVLERLRPYRLGFASIDTAGTELVEVNVANPGGLATLETVYGRSLSGPLADRVETWIQ